MDLTTFVNTYNGQSVSYDGIKANQGQCEQLVCLYWEKVYGFKCPPIPAAKDLWTNPTVLKSFQQIPVGQEQTGDVAVWGASNLIDSPEFGHTDIVLTHGFLGFDSNWGSVNNTKGYPIAHQVEHNYTDVLGFLRFKEDVIVMTNDTVEIAGVPASVSWGNNRIDLFVRGVDNGLYHKWWNGEWNGWEKLGTGLADSPSVASWASERLDVFALGTDGNVYHWWFDGKWNGPESQGRP